MLSMLSDSQFLIPSLQRRSVNQKNTWRHRKDVQQDTQIRSDCYAAERSSADSVCISFTEKLFVTVELAALEGLTAVGWDTTGFEAKYVETQGDFARVTISTTHGGFSAIMQRQGNIWNLVAHGSAFNPAELEVLNVSLSILE